MQDIPISAAVPPAATNTTIIPGIPGNDAASDPATENFGDVLAREIVSVGKALDSKISTTAEDLLLPDTPTDETDAKLALQLDPHAVKLTDNAVVAIAPQGPNLVVVEHLKASVKTDAPSQLPATLARSTTPASLTTPAAAATPATPATPTPNIATQTANDVTKPALAMAATTNNEFAEHISSAAAFAASGVSLPAKIEEKLTQGLGAPRIKQASLDTSAPTQQPGVALLPTAPMRSSEVSIPQLYVGPQVASPSWADAVAQRVMWMANDRVQVAELHLNPPELGPMTVRLTIADEQTSVLFVSAHASVREAIETAMPKLREMMAESGINLGNSMVSSDSSPHSDSEQSSSASSSHGQVSQLANETTIARNLRSRGDGLVDTFA